ncbi:hypothetical protein HPB49_013140 [Dermacentor silvarum]|uniref:Uncharacterized protein n=1 Tax=Dermacentor silvarum TaxID=543639 RepID=A0ACB8CRB1_DERSI|nr:hypothetical protein HPB49_013140 [Dermacentor silvarum]
MDIPSPISQAVSRGQGLYQQYNIDKKPMTVKEFRRKSLQTLDAEPVIFACSRKSFMVRDNKIGWQHSQECGGE